MSLFVLLLLFLFFKNILFLLTFEIYNKNKFSFQTSERDFFEIVFFIFSKGKLNRISFSFFLHIPHGKPLFVKASLHRTQPTQRTQHSVFNFSIVQFTPTGKESLACH